MEYFNQNMRVVKNLEFQNEGSNGNQLRTIQNVIVNYIEEIQNPKIQAQPQAPVEDLIQFGDDTVTSPDSASSGSKKLNAFDMFAKKPSNTNTNTNGQPNLLSPEKTDNTYSNTYSNGTNTNSQTPTNTTQAKSSNFNFIKNNSQPTSNTNVTTTAPTQDSKPKSNAFGFVKPKATETSQTTQSTSQNSQNSLLDLNFSTPQSQARAGNILNMYGGSPNDQTGFMNVSFGNNYQQGGFNMPQTGFVPQQQGYNPNFNPQMGYGGGYPTGQQQFGQNGLNPGYPKKEAYDQLVQELQTGTNFAQLSEDKKKEDQAVKQKKDEQDKCFDFIKF